jgi:hypothetical protein
MCVLEVDFLWDSADARVALFVDGYDMRAIEVSDRLSVG